MLRTAAIILALALTACGTETHIAKPDDVYLTCMDEPAAPAGTGIVTDEQDAKYKQDLRAAWADCSSKVQYLHDWFSRLP